MPEFDYELSQDRVLKNEAYVSNYFSFAGA